MSVATRLRARFETWAWSEIIVIRVALVATYLVYFYASIIAFIAGIPIFSLVAWEGYTSIWATALGISALVTAIGALAERWEKVEKWGSLALCATMFAYTGSLNVIGFIAGDLDRQFIGAVSLIAMILPLTRFIYLAAQTGKKRVQFSDRP